MRQCGREEAGLDFSCHGQLLDHFLMRKGLGILLRAIQRRSDLRRQGLQCWQRLGWVVDSWREAHADTAQRFGRVDADDWSDRQRARRWLIIPGRSLSDGD